MELNNKEELVTAKEQTNTKTNDYEDDIVNLEEIGPNQDPNQEKINGAAVGEHVNIQEANSSQIEEEKQKRSSAHARAAEKKQRTLVPISSSPKEAASGQGSDGAHSKNGGGPSARFERAGTGSATESRDATVERQELVSRPQPGGQGATMGHVDDYDSSAIPGGQPKPQSKLGQNPQRSQLNTLNPRMQGSQKQRHEMIQDARGGGSQPRDTLATLVSDHPKGSRGGSRQSKGTRVFNYNEDDALNQSYVERVLAQGQQLLKSSKRYSAAQEEDPSRSEVRGESGGRRSTVKSNRKSQRQTPGDQLRYQSIDFTNDLNRPSDLRNASNLFVTHGDPRASVDPSQMSGYAHPSPLIEEVRSNNYGRIEKAMGQFVIGNHHSQTVTGRRDQQARNRYLRNSFQPGQGLKVKRQLHKSAAKFVGGGPGEHPGAVGPKAKANVPKPFVLYQISKNVDSMLAEHPALSNSQQYQMRTLGQQSAPGYFGLQAPNQDASGPKDINKSFLDFIEGGRTPGDEHRQTGPGEFPSSFVRRPFVERSQQQFDAKQMSALATSQQDTHATQQTRQEHYRKMPMQMRQSAQASSLMRSLDLSPSHASSPAYGISPSPALTNFHITDLLERSILMGSQEREPSKLRQIVEFYKRAVKGDKDFGHNSEIMIRNYRLHLVKDPIKEGIDEKQRALLQLNKGTSIHVSNSILKPEIHKYGTQVSDHLTHVYPELLSDPKHLILPPIGKSNRRNGAHRRSATMQSATSLSDQMYSQAPRFAPPEPLGNLPYDIDPADLSPQQIEDLQQLMEESRLQQQEDQRSHMQHTSLLESLAEEGEDKSQMSQSQHIDQRTIEYQGRGPAAVTTPTHPSEAGDAFMAEDLDPGAVSGSQPVDHDGVSSRPFTAVAASEFEIITETNVVFDRWLRNIVSQASVRHVEQPRRAKLSNGQEAAPRVLDINWSIAIANKSMIKEKPMPVELLTGKSFYDSKPYRHLSMLVVNQDIREWYSKFVLKTSSVKTFSQIVSTELQSMNYQDCKVAIDFSRHHLTHADPVMFRDDKIPLELFIDFDEWIKPLFLKVRQLRLEGQLEEEELAGIKGKTDYYYRDGSRKSIPVLVSDFDPSTQRFLVENKEQHISTWRSRLYVRLQGDQRAALEKQKQQVMAWKAESLHYLRVHRLINDQMLKRYSFLRLPNPMLEKVQKRVAISLVAYHPDLVRKLILQVEALFVFAILKATLYSQKHDPFIKGLLVEYKVPLDSKALTSFRTSNKEKTHLPGIEEYNMKGTKVELDHNSLLLMEEKYIRMPIFLYQITKETIGKYNLFCQPFDVEVLLGQQEREFKGLSRARVDEVVNHYPLQHVKFVAAQRVMSKYFHHMAKYKWVDAISKKISSFVKEDFDFNEGTCTREEQIDPCLMRLFYQLRLYMQTIIFQHFETALQDYTTFLLSFSLRDPEMKDSKVVEEIKMTAWVRLSLEHPRPAVVEPGAVINDVELIPLRTGPMIAIAALIDDAAAPGKVHKKQKIVTSPELEMVHKDMFQVILDMHNSLEEIDRVDAMVFPLLELSTPYLLVPDVKNNERLTHYIRIAEKLIDQSLKSTKKELASMNTFMVIFDKRVDNIIIDLKRRSFALQQEMSLAEDGVAVPVEAAPDSPAKGKAEEEGQSPKRKAKDNDDDDSYGAGSDEDQGEEEGYQGNEMAYKSVEIDDGLMRDELAYLRGMVWKIQESVHNQYDYGLVHLDCTAYKERILSHCESLIEHLESHLRDEFTHKMKTINLEITGVKGKLDERVDSIDAVIMLLDYIDALKNQDNKIADIMTMIADLAARMEYIESVKVMFPDHQYQEFLHMRNWPRAFKSYIEVRREELLSQKDSLYQKMSREIDEIFVKIEEFKETIKEAVVRGLVINDQPDYVEPPPAAPMTPTGDSAGTPSRADLSEEALEREAAKKEVELQRQRELATIRCFAWLGKEIAVREMKFDQAFIEGTYHKIDALKQEFDAVERATTLINKREALLGVDRTKFSELRNIHEDLKPLHELWQVASKFGKILPKWVVGDFEQIDAAYVELKTEEWLNELKRLQKTGLVAENGKQQELQRYMIDSLNHFKTYGPMMRTLRTKGLAARHWRTVSQKLGLQIDPACLTLYDLIKLRLHDELKMKVIKQVCEVATKEYAVQQALEGLEAEMRAVEFEFEFAQDGTTIIVTKLTELVGMYEEFYLRISVLKSNPNIKSFYEKLLDIERLIKNVTELINEWTEFQRNFIYLNGIFVLEEIQTALPSETKFFVGIQQLYNQTTNSFKTQPQVHRINGRENFLSVLMRSNQDCESIRHGLRHFLERKRGKFPRLFFLSNEELIDIFGKGTELVDSMVNGEAKGFIANLFEGIDHVKFHPVTSAITHMVSADGEEVLLAQDVLTKGMSVDSWLLTLEQAMINTIKGSLFSAFENQGKQELEEWILSWPGQATYLGSQVWFTMKLLSIFEGNVLRERAAQRAAAPPRKPDSDGEARDSDAEDSGSDVERGEQSLASPQGTPARAPTTPGSHEEDAEEVFDDERAYTEEVFRQIAKDEHVCPERAQLEKVLRIKQRFRINAKRLPGRQLEEVYETIASTILQLTGMVRKRLAVHVRLATVALLTCHVYCRDTLANLIRQRVYSRDDFVWQIQFKYEVRGLQDAVHKSAHEKDPTETGKYETQKLDVEFEVFGHTRKYGFEYLGNCPRLVVTPLTERCQRSLLVALQYHYGGAPEGPFGTGKTESTKDLSRQLGKLCFVMNCSADYDFAGMCKFFKGVASSGAWVCFDEFNRMEPQMLLLVAGLIISLQTAIQAGALAVLFEDAKVVLKQDCAVFITINPGAAGRSELPPALKALFRPVSMVVPDSTFIAEILLYSSGFVGAQPLAQKLVRVQNSSSMVLQKTDNICHDFGLRAIKAIVGIAETLKLQAQGIIDCEMTEIIDDESMTQVPYKSDQIVRDVMGTTMARVTRQAEAEDPAAGQEDGGGLFDDCELSDEDLNADQATQKRGGELYKQLWRRQSYEERQLRAVYLKIGLDPDKEYAEEVLEEHIILKAIRDFNYSKFSQDDQQIIDGVMKDVFKGIAEGQTGQSREYGNLKEALKQSFEQRRFDSSKVMLDRALQLYDIVGAKHGCILVGEPQSGKSSVVNLLQSALNRAAINEYTLRISDKRRSALVRMTREKETEQMLVDSQAGSKMSAYAKGNGGGSNDMMGGGAKAKARRTDRDAQSKKALGVYQELYKRTKLTEEELDTIRANLTLKGVSVRRMNPKGMTTDELFGTFDEASNEWHEGLFTQEFRQYAAQTNDKKKWLLLDGPVDHAWVENLNSILDDNKKMSLPNGEQMKMAEGMCILLETDNVRNVTPATISRCGLIYMNRPQTCNPKAIFNQWLRDLPPNLQEYQRELEANANYFMVDAIEVFELEKSAGRLNFGLVDVHWLIQTFVRLLTCLIFDFVLEYEKSNAQVAAAALAGELAKSAQNLTLGNKWTDNKFDPNMTIYAEPEGPLPPGQSRAGQRTPSELRVQTPAARARDLAKKKRLPVCNFIDSELRFENALKFTPILLESYLLFSIVWTFYPVLGDHGRKVLNERLQSKFNAARSDFGVYQRERKRKMQEKNREKTGNASKLIKAAALRAKPEGAFTAAVLQGQVKQAREKDQAANADGLTSAWTTDGQERPLLISNFPDKKSFFDYYFSLDTAEWTKFNLKQDVVAACDDFDGLVPSQRKISNLFVPSIDSIRYAHILECLVTKQTSSLVVGPACSGKSTILRQLLFHDVFAFTHRLSTEHVTLSLKSDSIQFKDSIESMLEWRDSKNESEKRLRPPHDNKLVVFIEDLHLCRTDAAGDQSTIESIRDYLTAQCWLSSRKRRLRKIEDVSFFACMSSDAPESKIVSRRALHRFNLIALGEFQPESMAGKYQIVADSSVTTSWPKPVRRFAKNLVSALVDISERVFAHLRPTPLKSHYRFCWRDLDKVMFSLQLVEGNSLQKQEDVMVLFYHECLRTYGDRILMTHDQAWFQAALEEVCRRHFDILPDSDPELNKAASPRVDTGQSIDMSIGESYKWPIADPNNLFFSYWNQEVEGFYMKVEHAEGLGKIIANSLERFNDSNERQRISLMLYNQLNRHMVKMLRILQSPSGHVVNIAMKGYGMKAVVNLVTFTAGHVLKEIDMYEGFTDEEWRSELRRCLMQLGNEDKPITFYVDEYKLIKDEWYADLECLLKNDISTEIVRQADLMQVMQNIYKDITKEKEGMRLGLSAEDLQKENVAQYESQKYQKEESEEQKRQMQENSKKLFQKWPHIQAEMYKYWMNRVKFNFHLVLQYSPTGSNFKQKILKHKELLSLSEMLFMRELPSAELEQLGVAFIEDEKEQELQKQFLEGTNITKPQKLPQTRHELELQNKVLKAIVKIYLFSQEAAKKYSEELDLTHQFTPAHFIRIFQCYKRLLKERQATVCGITDRYDAGLQKIKQTQDAIYAYHQELEKKGPMLQDRMRHLFRIISDIEGEFVRVKGQRDQLKRDEFEAGNQTEHALKIKNQCEDTLNRIVPALNSSMNSIESLSKFDLAELKSLKKPPKVVKLLLEIVCLLLDVPPAPKKCKKTGKPKLSYWQAALGREVLGNPRLPTLLIEFDRNKLTAETMMTVEEVLRHPEYTFTKANTASKAATGIFKWVKATRDYFYIFKEIEPRRDAFMLSDKQYREKQVQLQDKQNRIVKLDTALVGLKEHQQSKDQTIETLQQEIQECSVRKKRADHLLRGLSAEKQKWIVCMRMLTSKSSTVVGDVLLTAGYVTFLSGFSEKYRHRAIQRWKRFMEDDDLLNSPDFNFTELFGDSYTMRRWHQHHLPPDTVSINNALVISKTQRYCLVLDPQMQGVTWLKAMADEQGTLIALKQHEEQFRRMMEMSIEMGKTVVVQQVRGDISLALQSIMKKDTSDYGGQDMINFNRKSYKHDRAFRLFVVVSDVRPRYDVNITNHITMVNFSTNTENLKTQMLSMVVMNERNDLENALTDNSKEAFEAIKALKDIEGAILSQLETEVLDLLGDENLIRTLNESKNTAEYVASKLKNITVTNQFIKSARDVYLPVAYRASVLFQSLQDLQKIDPIYVFSLKWFKSVFKKALELTNVVRSDPDQGPRGAARPGITTLPTFTVEERLDLLSDTLTQELFKKVQIAVKEQDRQLVTCLMAIRILESEELVDQPLLRFLLDGAPNPPSDIRIPSGMRLPWMSKRIWGDLAQLRQLRPFNKKNLLDHMVQNGSAWDAFYKSKADAESFVELPNSPLLDVSLLAAMELQTMTGTERDPTSLSVSHGALSATSFKVGTPGLDPARSIAATVAGDGDTVISGRRPKTQGGTSLKRTESEILNDPEIWMVSDSDDELDLHGEIGRTDDEAREQEAAAQMRDENKEVVTEEQEMARYLVEVAPAITTLTQSTMGKLLKDNKNPQTQVKRERTLRALSELCVLRCLKPELLSEAMGRLVSIVLDPYYFNFRQDLLNGILAQKKGQQQNLPTEQEEESVEHEDSINASNAPKNENSKETDSQDDGEGTNQEESKSQVEESQTQEQAPQHAAAGNNQKSIKQKLLAKKGFNNPNALLREAYSDSDARTPIVLITNDKPTTHQRVYELHKKQYPSSNASGAKLVVTKPANQGQHEQTENLLIKAAFNGDWIILDNLDELGHWLEDMEEIITKWKNGPELNSRFRMWIIITHPEKLPISLLERSVKVAVKPPITFKQKVMNILNHQTPQTMDFKKSNKFSNIHKNIFFGLSYLHALLPGRHRYGTLGWNMPYEFGESDFEICNAQLTLAMKLSNGTSSKKVNIKVYMTMLRYMFAQINYGGKISRPQDQKTLESILGDLMSDQILNAKYLDQNYEMSHCGYPTESSPNFLDFFDRNLPFEDPDELFGFDYIMASHLHCIEAYDLFQNIDSMDATKHIRLAGLSKFDTIGGGLAVEARRRCLKGQGKSGAEVLAFVKDDQSMLSLFMKLWLYLSQGSLCADTMPGNSRDTSKKAQLQVQAEIFMRDNNDNEVLRLLNELVRVIDETLPIEKMLEKYPITYTEPINNVIRKELQRYGILFDTMKASIREIGFELQGTQVTTPGYEPLWERILENRVPHQWSRVGFSTAHTALSDYLIELSLKMNFWKNLYETENIADVPSFWLPAFFSPLGLLNTILESRSRHEGIPLGNLSLNFEIEDCLTTDEPCEDEFAFNIHGLWLDSAKWDMKARKIVEVPDLQRFNPFPVVKVNSILSYSQDLNNMKGTGSKSNLKILTSPTNSMGVVRSPTNSKYGLQTHTFECPIYKTILRLSDDSQTRSKNDEVHPVAHIKMASHKPANCWTKQGVALLLEKHEI